MGYPSSRSGRGEDTVRSPHLSVGELVDVLGTHVLRLVVSPGGGEQPIMGPLVEGLDDEEPATGHGRILLSTRPVTSEADLLNAVQTALDLGCTAVALKAPDVDQPIIERAGHRLGVAVLTTPTDTSWRHLDRLIAAACQTADSAQEFTATPSSDLFALANEIAYTVGGAVTIEDNADRVLAHSNLPHQETDESRRQTILGREVPSLARLNNAVPRKEKSGHVVHVNPVRDGELGRLAIVVRLGDEILGTIWVIEREPLGRSSEEALQRAASVVALQLIRNRSTSDPDRRGRVDAMMTLLDGAAGRATAAARLGIDTRTAYTVLAMGPASDEHDADLGTSRLLEVASIYCGAWHPAATCAISGTTVYALIPVRETPGANEHLRQLARDVVNTLHRTAVFAVRVGIGSIATGRENIHTSRRVADTVLRAISIEPDVEVATADEVRGRVVLAELRASALGAFELGVSPVQALIDYDHQHGSDYARTLLVWLDCFGEARPAAQTMFIHENTLRYRVRRISQRFNIDLTDPHVRLVTWLELRLRT